MCFGRLKPNKLTAHKTTKIKIGPNIISVWWRKGSAGEVKPLADKEKICEDARGTIITHECDNTIVGKCY
jgi:hypothetical protein